MNFGYYRILQGIKLQNELSLVGIQLPEKYKENFDVSSEGPSSGVKLQTHWKLLDSRESEVHHS